MTAALAWIAGGGLVAVLIAAAVLNPAAALKLASSAVGLVMDTARGAINWIRKDREPVEWWRMACFALGVAFAFAAFDALDSRREIVVIRRACDQEKGEIVQAALEDVAAVEQTVARVRQNEQSCRANLVAEVGKRQQIERDGDRAVAAARRDEAAAERELADWQKRFDDKPKLCADAIAQLDAVCPAFSR